MYFGTLFMGQLGLVWGLQDSACKWIAQAKQRALSQRSLASQTLTKLSTLNLLLCLLRRSSDGVQGKQQGGCSQYARPSSERAVLDSWRTALLSCAALPCSIGLAPSRRAAQHSSETPCYHKLRARCSCSCSEGALQHQARVYQAFGDIIVHRSCAFTVSA